VMQRVHQREVWWDSRPPIDEAGESRSAGEEAREHSEVGWIQAFGGSEERVGLEDWEGSFPNRSAHFQNSGVFKMPLFRLFEATDLDCSGRKPSYLEQVMSQRASISLASRNIDRPIRTILSRNAPDSYS
jgi:hypothetical protein